MTGSEAATARPDGTRQALPAASLDEGVLLARAAALGIPVPPDRVAAVLDGARNLIQATRLLDDALPAIGPMP